MSSDDRAPPNRLLDGYFEDIARLARLAEFDARLLDVDAGGGFATTVQAHERALLVPLGPASETASLATVTAPSMGRGLWIGLAVAIAGLVLLLMQPWSVQPARDDAWIAKGDKTFALQVVVERRGAPVQIRSGDVVRSGERFGLFVDSPKPGHGAVWFVEAKAPPTRLFPRSGTGRLRAGTGIALPDGGAFTQTDQACEWIVGVHAARPIDHDALVAALRSAKPGPDCALTVSAPKDVRVAIVALRRGQASR